MYFVTTQLAVLIIYLLILILSTILGLVMHGIIVKRTLRLTEQYFNSNKKPIVFVAGLLILDIVFK